MKFNTFNRMSNHSNFTYLSEISRKNLVGKTKAQSPARYNKRLKYRASNSSVVDVESLITKDILIANVLVGDYICTVAYNGIIKQLLEIINRQPKPNVTLQSVIKAISQAVDKTDILVDCECADFKYRYAYWATKYGYKYGTPETRPPKITNPKDNIGSMCKHLTLLLSNKRWLIKLSSVVNNHIKQCADEIRMTYNLDEDEFIVNDYGRPSYWTDKNTAMLDKSNDHYNNGDEEELDLNIEEEE